MIDGEGKAWRCRRMGSGTGFGWEYWFFCFFWCVEKGNAFNCTVEIGSRLDFGWEYWFFGFFFWCVEEKNYFNVAIVCPCIDGEGDPGAAHPPPGAGEGQRVVQGLLQPLHHMPQNQDAQRQPTQEWPGGALFPQPLFHQPPPSGNSLKITYNHHHCMLANRHVGPTRFEGCSTTLVAF